jgi:hypothetical protein
MGQSVPKVESFPFKEGQNEPSPSNPSPPAKVRKLEIRNSVGVRMPMVRTCNSTVRYFNVFVVSGGGKLLKITHGGIGTRRFAQVLVWDLF